MTKAVCPNCSHPADDNPINRWKFRSYTVERHQCRKCKVTFNQYTSENRNFTIPKAR
jgi:formylmethanofuran dehydrogenase subunit B